MKSIKRWTKISGFLIMALTFVVAHASGQVENRPQSVVDSAVTTLNDFASNAGFQKHIKDAKGILIVPSVKKSGEASGVLLFRVPGTRKWSYPAFYSMTLDTFALQADVDKAEVVLLVMTNKAMNAMLSGKVQPGVDVSVAAGSAGAVSADILQFSLSKGVFGGLTVKGGSITVHQKWNKEYYGRHVLTADILTKHSVQITGADDLRRAVSRTLSR